MKAHVSESAIRLAPEYEWEAEQLREIRSIKVTSVKLFKLKTKRFPELLLDFEEASG